MFHVKHPHLDTPFPPDVSRETLPLDLPARLG